MTISTTTSHTATTMANPIVTHTKRVPTKNHTHQKDVTIGGVVMTIKNLPKKIPTKSHLNLIQKAHTQKKATRKVTKNHTTITITTTTTTATQTTTTTVGNTGHKTKRGEQPRFVFIYYLLLRTNYGISSKSPSKTPSSLPDGDYLIGTLEL